MRCIALISLFSGWCLFTGTTPVVAQTEPSTTGSESINLVEIVDYISANNRSIRAELLRSESISAGAGRFESLPDPMASVSFQPFPVLSARGTLRSQWSVSQNIPFPGELRSRSELVRASSRVVDEQVGILHDQLVLDAKIAYYQLIQIRDRLALTNDFEVRLDNFAESAAVLYEVGSGSQHAILKAQIERSQLDHIRIELETARSSATQKLAHLLSPETVGIVLEDVNLPAFDTELLFVDSLIAVALKNRPDLKTLRAVEDRAGAQSALARKENNPDFSIGITYIDVGKSNVIPTANGRDALGVMFGIKIPLWSKPKYARIQEASLAQNSARYRLLDQINVVETRVVDITRQLQLVNEKIALLTDDLIPKAEFSFEATLSSYTTGRTDFLDLLDSERTLYHMSNALAMSRFERRVLVAQLEHALGVTWMHELSN